MQVVVAQASVQIQVQLQVLVVMAAVVTDQQAQQPRQQVTLQ